MAESRIKNAFSRSTILTVGRLLAFIAVGFAVGLAIGVVTEEPELLAGHLRGDSETVELDAALAANAGEIEAPSEDGSATGLPPVGARPESFSSEGSPSDTWVGEAAKPGTAVALPVGAGGWAIQVGAFGDEPSAEKLADRLEGKGYPIEVLPAGVESNRWRVRVQPIGEEKAARATAERIEREERLPTWVIRFEGQNRS